MINLNGRVAIVTGAAQGIGKEVGLSLARAGADVVIVDVVDKLFEVVKDIKKHGRNTLGIKCDVSNYNDVKNAVDQVIDKFGGVDILVNNAGIYPFRPILEMNEEDWDKVIGVNLKGVFNFTKAVLPKMIEQKRGKIINIASIAGAVVGFMNLTHYSASKAGIVGFTKSLALEVAKYRINVNAISPGPILTEGTEILGHEMYEQIKMAIPIGRWGKPEDVANLVIFLASDESNFITGQNIVIDGGYTLQ
ncbi:MAG: SDR family oxidoreductase [Nitrososphaeria archaeon]|nr:SDR family oxidoreductase [Aigarchaeota archaeon]MCX8187073.1 SDR family oxidoreductase [Nitrososphaeria archaeon]